MVKGATQKNSEGRKKKVERSNKILEENKKMVKRIKQNAEKN